MKRIRAVGIVLHEDKLLVIGRIVNGKSYCVFPGGGVEQGESVEDAVVRELLEEASIKVKPNRLLYHLDYTDHTEHFFYLCDYVQGKPALDPKSEEKSLMDKGEAFYEPKWIPVDALKTDIIYPLEVRDWLIDDIANNFSGPLPRETAIEKYHNKAS